jgi:hypothetical protein
MSCVDLEVIPGNRGCWQYECNRPHPQLLDNGWMVQIRGKEALEVTPSPKGRNFQITSVFRMGRAPAKPIIQARNDWLEHRQKLNAKYADEKQVKN